MAGNHPQTNPPKKGRRKAPARMQDEKPAGKDKPVTGNQPEPVAALTAPSGLKLLACCLNDDYADGIKPAVAEAWNRIGKPGGKAYSLKKGQSIDGVSVNVKSVVNYLNSVPKDADSNNSRLVARLAKTLGLK